MRKKSGSTIRVTGSAANHFMKALTYTPSISDQINTSMASSMASKLDSTIKGALDAHWGVWSTDDLKRRCKLVTVAGSPVQTLYADEVPILEIHPLEVETVRTDIGWTLRATQNYRRLSVGKSEKQT